MERLITPAYIHKLFEGGEYIQAYTSAFFLFAKHPDDYEKGLLFLRAAIFVERLDSVKSTLNDLAEQIPAQSFNLLMFQVHLCNLNIEGAWQHLKQSSLPEDSVAYHDCAFRIALQAHNLSAALDHLTAIERKTNRPLSHHLKKFEILKIQGEYDQIQNQISLLQKHIQPTDKFANALLILWEAGIAHSRREFAKSLHISEQLIRNFASDSLLSVHVQPAAKPWTRHRQHQLIRDLERLMILHQLPLFLVAGSILGPTREGDFFLCDKDIDLGVLDADFEPVAQKIIDSGYFDDVSPPNYFIGYKQLRHRATGFTVDITHYHTKGGQIHAIWQDTSGEILRETVFDRFTLREVMFPNLRCSLLAPDPVDIYLTNMYGDWKTPNPYFDTVIAACNLKCLTPFLVSLGFIKIADALLNKNIKKAKSGIQHLFDAGFQSQLLADVNDLL